MFTKAELAILKKAIEQAELNTSGEIRVLIEKKCTLTNSMERAQHLFVKHQMHQTKNRNGILLYIAYKTKQIAIYADEGIYKILPPSYWQSTIDTLIIEFKESNYIPGICNAIHDIGVKLQTYFKYDKTTDVNELSNEIIQE